MSADISGWVEVQDQNNDWRGVIQIDHLVQRTHCMFSLLFGDKDDNDLDVIAGRPGIPIPHSDEVAFGLQRGPDPIHPSWISWEELSQIDWDLYDRRDTLRGGWVTLMRMMDLLAQDIDYGWGMAWDANRIRLVVWFDMPWG